MNGLPDLRDWLTAHGFRVTTNSLGLPGNACDWYAYRRSGIPARSCECNDRQHMQLVVRPYINIDRPEWSSVEVDVTGEAGGVWFKLQAYSLTVDDLRAKLPAIEAALMAAWNAIPTGQQTQGEAL